MNLSLVMIQTLSLFIILFVGYFLRQRDIISQKGIKSFSTLIFYVTMPAMILNAMSKNVNVKSGEIGKILTIALFTYAFLFGMSMIVPKLLRVKKEVIGLYRFMAMFGNVGFIGYPVIRAIFGDAAVFYGAIFNIPYDVLLYTVGIYFISSDTDKQSTFNIRKMITPGFAATLIGLVIFIGEFKMPFIVSNITTMLGNMTTPLAMIVVGGSLYGVKAVDVLRNKRVFIYSSLKLIVFPALLAFLLTLFKVEGLVAGIPVVIIGMPIATNTVILSQEYKGHILLASEAVFISILMSVFTIPLLALIVSLI